MGTHVGGRRGCAPATRLAPQSRDLHVRGCGLPAPLRCARDMNPFTGSTRCGGCGRPSGLPRLGSARLGSKPNCSRCAEAVCGCPRVVLFPCYSPEGRGCNRIPFPLTPPPPPPPPNLRSVYAYQGNSGPPNKHNAGFGKLVRETSPPCPLPLAHCPLPIAPCLDPCATVRVRMVLSVPCAHARACGACRKLRALWRWTKRGGSRVASIASPGSRSTSRRGGRPTRTSGTGAPTP
jgi:hypothetical protein